MMFGLYLHIPFCRHRCSYCDFNTYAGLEAWMAPYVRALQEEMAWVRRQFGGPVPVDTVYFGGGTPSLLPIPLWEGLFRALHTHFQVAEDAEITVEANPESVTEASLRALRALGVNRLSLGMQAVHPQDLRLLSRVHDFPAVIRAVALARKAGFENLNVDLIYGLPGQPLTRWQETLAWALRLAPDHLSCYALTLEHGTPLQAWVARGRVPEPDDDLAADMYAWTREVLEEAGFVQYELSNWARPDRACRHNLKYWRWEPYLGLGAGAHGFAAGVRTANVRAPQAYVQRLLKAREPARPFPWTPATVVYHRVSPREAAEELMFMGLRLVQEGVPRARFERVVGRPLEDVYGPVLQELAQMELVVWDTQGVRLTPRALPVANQVFVRLLDPPLPGNGRGTMSDRRASGPSTSSPTAFPAA